MENDPTQQGIRDSFNKPSRQTVYEFMDCVRKKDAAAVSGYLQKYGCAIVDEKDSKGWTGLMHATNIGSRNMLELLLNNGAALDETDRAGTTALMLAAKNGYSNIAAALLEKGAAPDKKNNKGEPALIVAAACGQRDVVEVLLEKGASADIKDNNGWTALTLAARNGFKSVATLLEQWSEIQRQRQSGNTSGPKISEDTRQILNRLEELQAQVRELTGKVDRLSPSQPDGKKTPTVVPPDAPKL